jgi:hypothetical protein
MLTHLRLKFGSATGQPPLVVETPPSVTVFVGPNNAVKSQALRELFMFCSAGQLNSSAVIVDGLQFAEEDPAKIQREFETIKVRPNPRETVAPDHSIVAPGRERIHVPNEKYLRARTLPNERPVNFAQWHLKHFTLNLDGPGRIGLVAPQPRGDLKYPQTDLARLLTNDPKRSQVRKTILDAVNLHLAIDAQSGDQLSVRFGLSPPPDERSFNDEALEYMRKARGTDAVSDGVKAFTGILIQLSVGDPKVIIIDEPEAFLHPSLVFTLGKELASGAVNEGKHVFAATHSPQFVMGAILSGAKVNIVRLTHADGIGTARLLSSADLTKLMRDPLLRSAGVLAGLFYDHVIVAEADADRAFYQEINERLLAAQDPRGIAHALFLNAENKQTISRIVEPLRKLGIPTAAIADIDVINEGRGQWTRHLKACAIPAEEHQPYGTRRGRTLGALESKSDKFKTAGGIELLLGSEREAAENLFDDLARYGLFVVRRGEVEAWLSELDVPRTKEGWLRGIFERMGSDPAAPGYTKPRPGDVWDFIGQVRLWLTDRRRRGIPL